MSDTIKRVSDRTKGFTIMVNEVFQRKDLSARAKGLFGYLMTLPSDWRVRKVELFTHFTEGREALDTAFNELMETGYITRTVKKEQGKFVAFEYTIHESTINGFSVTGNPVTGKPLPENQQLLSTDLELSTKEQKTEKVSVPHLVIAYLNEKTGSKFGTTKAHSTMILARVKDGYTVDDFKAVVDKRVAKWRNNPKMAEYLRPSTLFCAGHFDEYLNDNAGANSTPLFNTDPNDAERFHDPLKGKIKLRGAT